MEEHQKRIYSICKSLFGITSKMCDMWPHYAAFVVFGQYPCDRAIFANVR